MSTNPKLIPWIIADTSRGSSADDMVLLLQYATANSQSAFTELVARHHRLVRSTCRRILRDHDLADDATQTVFMTLARRAALLSPGVRLGGWLHQTARNVAADLRKQEMRRWRRHQRIVQSSEFEPPDDNLRLTVAAIIADLPAYDRSAIVMRYFEGFTIGEIADALGLTREGAKKRLSRARMRVRQLLGARQWLVPLFASWCAVLRKSTVARAMLRAVGAVAGTPARLTAVRLATTSALVSAVVISRATLPATNPPPSVNAAVQSSSASPQSNAIGGGRPSTLDRIAFPSAPARYPASPRGISAAANPAVSTNPPSRAVESSLTAPAKSFPVGIRAAHPREPALSSPFGGGTAVFRPKAISVVTLTDFAHPAPASAAPRTMSDTSPVELVRTGQHELRQPPLMSFQMTYGSAVDQAFFSEFPPIPLSLFAASSAGNLPEVISRTIHPSDGKLIFAGNASGYAPSAILLNVRKGGLGSALAQYNAPPLLNLLNQQALERLLPPAPDLASLAPPSEQQMAANFSATLAAFPMRAAADGAAQQIFLGMNSPDAPDIAAQFSVEQFSAQQYSLEQNVPEPAASTLLLVLTALLLLPRPRKQA